jgi:hypothetical protein
MYTPYRPPACTTDPLMKYHPLLVTAYATAYRPLPNEATLAATV